MSLAATSVAFVGAGRVASTLAQAMADAGWRVAAVGSRSPQSAQALAATVPGCRPCEPQEAADAADLVFVTVPDDHIAGVAAQLRWRPAQAVVHCSGATEIAVLAPAAALGALVGGFHPLQLFAEPALALRHLRGCAVALEAPPALEPLLRLLAEDIGYRPFVLPPGARGLYHAGSCYAASFLLSLLREACDLWNGFGLSDAQALAALLPLAEGTLAAAREKGLAGALAGPFSRGDSGVVARHLRDVALLDPARADLYRALSEHQLRLARERGRLDQEALARLRQAIESGATREQ